MSDGEYGKVGALGPSMCIVGSRASNGALFSEAELKDPMIAVISGRDREAFPEFYAEYDARVLAVARSAGRPIVTAPLVYTGQAEELQRDIANLKAGLARTKGVTGFLPVVAPASALPNARNVITAMRKASCSRSQRRSELSIARSLTPGSTSRSTTHSFPSCTRRWCRR